MTGADFHKSYHKKERRMDLDMDSSNVESELNNSIPAACSSNGSGGEEDEAEAIGRGRESGGSSSKHTPDGGGVLCGGREQEVSVDIGETYLCQRADKTWREWIVSILLQFKLSSLVWYNRRFYSFNSKLSTDILIFCSGLIVGFKEIKVLYD